MADSRLIEYEQRALQSLNYIIDQLISAKKRATLDQWLDDQLSVEAPEDPNSTGHDILITYGGPTVYLDTGTAKLYYHENSFDNYTLQIDNDICKALETAIND